MKLPRVAVFMVWAGLIACSVGCGEQKETGELVIYPDATENGTVARREFSDEEGNIIKEIYYRVKPGSDLQSLASISEKDLAVSSIRTLAYDESGRETRMDVYSPEMELERAMHTYYDDQGSLRSRVWHRSDGTREYEIRYRDGASVCDLYFDVTGKELITARGRLPEDLAESLPWGEEVGGLSCALGVDRKVGALEEIEFSITVRNLNPDPAELVQSMQYEVVRLELCDAHGRLVEQDEELVNRRTNQLLEWHHGLNEHIWMVSPHQCVTNGYPLRQWYSNLPAGAYSLVVRRRAAGEAFELVSKPVEFTLVEKEADQEAEGAGGDREP